MNAFIGFMKKTDWIEYSILRCESNKHNQRKSEFSVKDMLYSLIDDIEDDEQMRYVVYFLRGLYGNNKRSVGGV